MISKLHIRGYEKILKLSDEKQGFTSIMAVYSTACGPAIGGCRMLPYTTDQAALEDVLRLAKNMAYKCAMAEVPYGGGKSVIIPPKGNFNRTDLLKSFARFVNHLEGKYITAIDSGTNINDMAIIAKETNFVTGFKGQPGFTADPSYYTALGVFQGIKAAAYHRYGGDEPLSQKSIFIKGAGNVTSNLVNMLESCNMDIYICDIVPNKAEILAKSACVKVVSPCELYSRHYHFICPCDTGFTVTENNIDSLNTDIIVGATNNQLQFDELATELRSKGIIYCPDYVVNSGGLIYVTKLFKNISIDLGSKIERLYETTLQVIKESEDRGISTKETADHIAHYRIHQPEIETTAVS